MQRTLRDLNPGESGIISGVGNKSAAVKRRLVDMGLTPGTKITVKKTAPFGDPIEVTLRGYELSLRKEDASQIELLPKGGSGADIPRGSKIVYPGRRLDSETLQRMRRDHEHELSHHIATYDSEARQARNENSPRRKPQFRQDHTV